jgi:predicted nucleic acid-binding protein
MKPITAVIDSDMIIGLAKGGVFELLRSLFAAVYVPHAVVHEVIGEGHGRAGEQELHAALGVWIAEVAPVLQQIQQFDPRLTPADREVLAVAHAHAADYVLSNDIDLQREAKRHGLVGLQTPNVVVLLKDQGLIPKVAPVLDQMRQSGFGIDHQSYEDALRAAGEPAPVP